MVEPDAEIQNWTHSALEKKSSGSNACGDVTPPPPREGGGWPRRRSSHHLNGVNGAYYYYYYYYYFCLTVLFTEYRLGVISQERTGGVCGASCSTGQTPFCRPTNSVKLLQLFAMYELTTSRTFWRHSTVLVGRHGAVVRDTAPRVSDADQLPCA